MKTIFSIEKQGKTLFYVFRENAEKDAKKAGAQCAETSINEDDFIKKLNDKVFQDTTLYFKKAKEKEVSEFEKLKTEVQKLKQENEKLKQKKALNLDLEKMIEFSKRKTNLIRKRAIFMSKKEKLKTLELNDADNFENSGTIRLKLVKVSSYNESREDDCFFVISNVHVIQGLVKEVNKLIDTHLEQVETDIQLLDF